MVRCREEICTLRQIFMFYHQYRFQQNGLQGHTGLWLSWRWGWQEWCSWCWRGCWWRGKASAFFDYFQIIFHSNIDYSFHSKINEFSFVQLMSHNRSTVSKLLDPVVHISYEVHTIFYIDNNKIVGRIVYVRSHLIIKLIDYGSLVQWKTINRCEAC